MGSSQKAAATAESSAPQTRRSLCHGGNNVPNSGPSTSAPTSTQTSKPKGSGTANKSAFPPQDFIVFFAGLNVNMRLVTTIAQEMTTFYALCKRYKEDFKPLASLAVYSVEVERMDTICTFACPGHVTALLLRLAVMVTGQALLMRMA